MVTNFFLGANSSAGFRSLYQGFIDPERNFDIMVLKGGPGVGKSSFMKYIGSRAEEAGEDVEYIWCSGDPDSLDAVRLPRVGIIAVDGTSPHVVEPQYPAAVDRYVNLGQFYCVEECKRRREAILRHTADYKAAYVRAYRALQASGEVGVGVTTGSGVRATPGPSGSAPIRPDSHTPPVTARARAAAVAAMARGLGEGRFCPWACFMAARVRALQAGEGVMPPRVLR